MYYLFQATFVKLCGWKNL